MPRTRKATAAAAAKDTALPAIGAPFTVTEEAEFRDGRRLVARYQPKLGYRITDLNRAFVGGLIAQGKANIGVPGAGAANAPTANAPAAAAAKARGKVSN